MLNVEICETVLGPLKVHTNLVRSVAFSPDDLRIVSGSADRTVRIWDAQTGDQLLKFEKHMGGVTSIAFSSDGSKVVSSDYKNEILIWDVYSGRRVCCLEKSDHYFHDFFFSADDRFVVGTRADELTIWDVKSGNRVPTSLQAGSFGDLIWIGECALYARVDGEIRRWFHPGHSILDYDSTISPDRKWIAIAGEWDEIYLYSRDPSPEELASEDDINDEARRL